MLWRNVRDHLEIKQFRRVQWTELFVCSPYSHSKVMVLGGGAFQRQLGHKGASFMNEISAFITGTPESSLTVIFHHMNIQEDLITSNPEGIYQNWSCCHSDELPGSKTLRNKFLFTSHPISGTFFKAARLTKTEGLNKKKINLNSHHK